MFSPEQSPVVQVRATEIVGSKEAATKCTLRFPRVETVREDKDSSCCTSLVEVRTIQQMKGGKLYSSRQLEGQGENPRKRSRRRAELGQIYRQQDLSHETMLSHSLKDKVVVVEPGRLPSLKREVERLVMKHGGLVEQNLRAGRTSLYVETGLTVKGRGVLQRGEVDIVRSSWLTGQAELEKIEMPRPHQYLHMTEPTLQSWRKETDQYLDPLTIPATRESLQFSMEQV